MLVDIYTDISKKYFCYNVGNKCDKSSVQMNGNAI